MHHFTKYKRQYNTKKHKHVKFISFEFKPDTKPVRRNPRNKQCSQDVYSCNAKNAAQAFVIKHGIVDEKKWQSQSQTWPF